jgi:glucokinase
MAACDATRPARRVVVAVDVGGTSMKAGALGPAGVYELRRVPTGRERGPTAVLATLHDVVAELLERAEAEGLEPAAVGVAVPGVVDGAGVGRYSVTLGWRDLPVREQLEARLGRRVLVEHDVRAGAVAESSFGAAAGGGTCLFLPIGTGVAAAIVRDGIVAPGDAFQAGELGQVLVAAPQFGADGAAGRQDGLVTLEVTSSARGIGERYARATGRAVDAASARAVVAAMKTGDATASAVWAEAMDRLGGVLAATIAALDPGIVVVGGGLSRAGAELVDTLVPAIGAYLPWRAVPPVVVARFADDAGFVGCAIRAWHDLAGYPIDELAGVLGSGWAGHRAAQGLAS